MNRFCKVMERVYHKIPKKFIDYLYLLAFALVLVYDYAFLTRFNREPFRVLYMIGIALSAIVLALRFLNIKNENKIGVGVATLILIIGGGYLLVRHSFYFLVLATLIVGALRVEDRKILAVYLVIATLFFTTMLTHFLITNPEWKNEAKIHFGSINTTDCQCMVFFIVIAYLFYRGERVKYVELMVLGVITLWFWSYTRAEINMYCSLASLAIMCVKKCIKWRANRKARQIMGYVFSASFLVCAVIIMALAIRYNPDEEKWQRLNLILHQRLETPHRMYTLYPPSLWGNEYVQVGWGYSPGTNFYRLYAMYGYTYIDSSYPNVLINHGYFIFALILGVMTFVSFRYANKGDLFKVFLLAVIAMDCVAEGHLKELSCNLWLVLPFASVTNAEEDRFCRLG